MQSDVLQLSELTSALPPHDAPFCLGKASICSRRVRYFLQPLECNTFGGSIKLHPFVPRSFAKLDFCRVNDFQLMHGDWHHAVCGATVGSASSFPSDATHGCHPYTKGYINPRHSSRQAKTPSFLVLGLQNVHPACHSYSATQPSGRLVQASIPHAKITECSCQCVLEA